MTKIAVSCRAVLTVLAVLQVTSCHQKAPMVELPPSAKQGNQGTCYFRNESETVCITSFRRLQNSPASADGMKVSVKGYLAVRHGIPTLYATELDFLNDMVIESIVVRGDRGKLVRFLKHHAYTYVRVEGSFSVSDDTPGSPWIGEIEPSAVSDLEPMQRESTADILTNLEHLR